jgi:hypothetical protein
MRELQSLTGLIVLGLIGCKGLFLLTASFIFPVVKGVPMGTCGLGFRGMRQRIITGSFRLVRRI